MQKTAATITAPEMRGINRSAVLDLIRREGPIARTRIAECLKLSLMTVMRIVDELMAEDLVQPTGAKEFSGGRRRPLLEFNAKGHLVIGVDFNETRLYGAVADLTGGILTDLTLQQDPASEIRFESLVGIIDQLLQAARRTRKHIRGIGISAHGITYDEDGAAQWATAWGDLPVKERLAERFRLPVVLDNDVNLSALGEMWFGAGQDCTNLVLMTIGRGIQAGVIIDGAIYRGSHLTAGGIGFLVTHRSQLGMRRDEAGALASLAGSDGIAARGREALKSVLAPDPLAHMTAEDVFKACRAGEAWALPIVAETVDHLAQAVATLAVCYDPDIIVLGGSIAGSADLLIDPILGRIEGVIPVRPQLVASRLGHRAAILGMIIETLYNTADFYMVRKLQ